MASIVLSTVGQVAGAATGVPYASQIGGQIGATIGSRIDGGNSKHYEGPRLDTLAVQTSTYGRMIPITFGSVRISGNVIWSRPIREVATTTSTTGTGKGGSGQSSSSTEYSYYITLAIAVCEGEITRIDRVWADSELLDLSQGTYRIYKGSETQLPDAMIESYEGVGATPAYRGLAYVVIEDFPLGDFGNRIPNFTFEVTRAVAEVDTANPSVESRVTAVMLIPGSGEFVYDPTTEYKIHGSTVGGQFVQNGYQVVLNQHTPAGKANVEVALDQLQQTLPNLAWVGISVNWFGTSMDIASCEIWPCVEYQTGGITSPDAWSVAGLSRSTARQIGSDAGGIRYGGTPDDASLLRLLDSLRARGLKIFFYPQLLMDVSGKPWRGNLTGAASQVSNFFTKARGYNAFILHYANLVAGKVDAFAIGTEMRDLTKITSATGVFPSVGQLVSLAGAVKAMLGAGVKVTYAADWSEYHHTDGGWYHLDPLWASSAIDVVGIDAYFPLSDAVQTGYDEAALMAGWTSGEGYDWYYTDGGRTTKASLSAAYAWKNIAWWWNNSHTNPDGSTSAWTPGSKPIWFTEYGFASVDGCANQPNVFVDPTASSSAYPRFSRGRVDFMAQRTAISATEKQWAGSSMVTQKFLWTWDARPYPYWPDLLDVWADGGVWATGHWVTGKLGASQLGAIVSELMRRAGLADTQFDAGAMQVMVDGFVIHERVSARAAIDQLMQAYFFTLKESSGQLVLIPEDSSVDLTVDASVCVPKKLGDQEVPYVLTRKEDLVLPARLEVQFLNRLKRYATEIESAARAVAYATDTATVRLGLVLSQAQAQAIADRALTRRWSDRMSVTLQLPVRYAALEPGDVLQLNDGTASYPVRLDKVQIGRPGLVRVSGVVDSTQAQDGYIPPVIGSDGSSRSPGALTKLELLDIPAFPGDAQEALTVRFAACGLAPGWTGANILHVLNNGDAQQVMKLTNPATMGAAVTLLPPGTVTQFDRVNPVDVMLVGDATLANATEYEAINGANSALLGDEVIQFAQATLVSPGVYRLSTLLRGRLGTEWAMTTHAAGERFVLLDSAVMPLTIPSSNAGQSWVVRASSFGASLSSGTTITAPIKGQSLKPYAPVKLKAVRAVSGDVTLSWVRRTRIDGNLHDYVDIPLLEANELYELSIYNGATLLRRWRVTSPSAVYFSADQLADFGSFPATLRFTVAQLSALVGLGNLADETVTVTS